MSAVLLSRLTDKPAPVAGKLLRPAAAVDESAAALTFSYRNLRFVSLLVLASPVLLFFVTWLRLWVGIPAALLVGFALVWSWRRDTDTRVVKITYRQLALLVLLLAVWLWLSGVGGFFTQKKDHQMRNAIFHDLINYSWPVHYTKDRSLSYYIGIWLLPALVGKLGTAIGGTAAGWLAARIALFIYSLLMLTLTVLLLSVRLNLKTTRRLLIFLAIFVLFSGMDIIGVQSVNILNGPGYHNENHLEWYARSYQYSSNSTQLCWVYNQSIPAWLAMGLFLNEKSPCCYAMIGLLTLPCAPLPLVGLALLMIAMGIRYGVAAIREKKLAAFVRRLLGIENVTALTVVLGVFALYYMQNTHAVSGTNSGFRMSLKPFYMPDRTRLYLTFIVLEFLILALLLWKKHRGTLFITACVELLIFPFFVLGTAADFVMRASIPALFVLMLAAAECVLEQLAEKPMKQWRPRAIAVLLCLLIGAATPLTEYRSSFDYYYSFGGMYNYFNDNGSLEKLTDRATMNFIAHKTDESLFYRLIARKKG